MLYHRADVCGLRGVHEPSLSFGQGPEFAALLVLRTNFCPFAPSFRLEGLPADKCSTCSCGTCTADPYHVIPCFQGSGPAMYRRPRSSHTLSSCPWAGRRDLVYGFSVELALRQVGACAPLSPSLGLSQRAETTLLNKSVEISITTGRFCSRCRCMRHQGFEPWTP